MATWQRPLGKTGRLLSAIGLGTVKLGRNTDVKYPRPFELPTEEQVRALLDTALSLGITLIDTAPAYGESEARLGPFVRANRDRIVLCTKVGERYVQGRSTHDWSETALFAQFEESLRRLRTDHVDILLLHSDGQDVRILRETPARAFLARVKSEGRARAVGISAKTAEGILEACDGLDVVMAPFSQVDASRADALRRAHEQGLAILAIKGLASGRAPCAAEAIRFILRQPFVDSLVLGTLDPVHLNEAVAAARSVRASV